MLQQNDQASSSTDTDKIPEVNNINDEYIEEDTYIDEDTDTSSDSTPNDGNSYADNKPVLFNIVYLHGILKSYNIRDFRGKKCIRVSLSTSYDNFHDTNKKKPTDFLPAEVDIYVEKKGLVSQHKQWLTPGNMLLVEGKIKLSFNRTSQDSVKKRQYISVNNIISSKGPVIDHKGDRHSSRGYSGDYKGEKSTFSKKRGVSSEKKGIGSDI